MMLQNDGGHDDDNLVEFCYLFMNWQIQKPSGQLRTSRGGKRGRVSRTKHETKQAVKE
jgi:hypothetical protein